MLCDPTGAGAGCKGEEASREGRNGPPLLAAASPGTDAVMTVYPWAPRHKGRGS